MRSTVGGFYQGECGQEQAELDKKKYKDAKIIATCLPCGNKQELKTLKDRCKACSCQNWK